MKKSNVRKTALGALLVAAFGISMAMGMTVHATGQAESTKPVSLIYVGSEVSGINLNGNSVVIKKSTANNDCVNIYIDENRNGVIDENEDMVSLDVDGQGASTDIAATVPIYGLYCQSGVNTPISIVVESGNLRSIYGVYSSQINTTQDKALRIAVKGGILSDGLYGMENAGVITEVTKTAIDIDVSDAAIVKQYFTGVKGSYDITSKVVGNIDIDWNVANFPSADDGMYTFNGITNYATVEGDVDIYINKLRAQTINGLYYTVKVTGDYIFKSEFTTSVTHQFYGMYGSVVYGDADITVHGAQSDESTIPYVYGIYENYTGETTIVDGSCKIVYSGGYAGNLGAISVASQTVNGDVSVDIQSGKAENLYLLTGVTVEGSLKANVGKHCEIIEDCSGASSGHVKKDATINLYNAYTGANTKTNYCKALCNVPVDGNVSVVIDGGYYNSIYAIQNTSKNETEIGGQVDLTMRNVECPESSLIYETNVVKDVNLKIDNSKLTYIFVMNGVVAQGKTDIDIKNSEIGNERNSSNTYMLFGCKNVGVARVNVTDTSLMGSGSVYPCDTAASGSADVYFNMKNMTIGDSVKLVTRSAEGQELHMIMNLDTKVGETTTAEKPLADLSTLLVGMMYLDSYTNMEVSGLPGGIKFENDKIYGTPTKAYPNGKDATISMTDGSKGEKLTIHFVIAKKDCVFDDSWTCDEKYHWHACTHACEDESCDEIKDKAEHTWDDGVVTKESTETEKGEKTYTCTVCKTTKPEEIPMKEEDKEGNTGDTTEDETQNSTEEEEVVAPSKKGTVLKDTDKKGDYTVTNADPASPEVSYKVTSKTAKEIVIPKTVIVDGVEYKVTSIKSSAFKNHKNLKKITIGANVKTIGKNAFYGCKKLTTVKMGKNVTSIGANAFYNCTALKKIEIPSKVNAIGTKAFYGCKKLTNIAIKTIKLTTKKVGKKAFTKAGSSNYKKLTVKVPKSKLKTYKKMLKSRGLSSKATVKK